MVRRWLRAQRRASAGGRGASRVGRRHEAKVRPPVTDRSLVGPTRLLATTGCPAGSAAHHTGPATADTGSGASKVPERVTRLAVLHEKGGTARCRRVLTNEVG